MLKFVLVVAVFALVVYAVAWTIERRRFGSSGARPQRLRRPKQPPTKQVAPDDDEDFLRWLEQKRRKGSSGTDPTG